MRNSRILITVGALLVAAAVHGASTPSAAAPIELALVNGESITDSDLKRAFVGKHGGHTTFLGGDLETRRFLDIVINERLLIQEAYNLGLDSDPLVKPQVDVMRNERSSQFLLQQEIEKKATSTPEEIRAAWEKAGELFIAREIVLDTREEAESVRRSLIAGADFEALARLCSIATSRNRGGNLQPFTWGSLLVEIETAAFALEPGEITPVIVMADGWRIIQMVNRGDAWRPPLDDKVSARIAAKLKERRIAALTDALSSYLWSRFGAEIAVPGLNPNMLTRLLKSAPDTPLVKWNGGELTVKQVFTASELKMYSSFAPGRAAQKMDRAIHDSVSTSLVQLEAKERKIAEVPEVASAIDTYESKLMESAIYTKHVLVGVKVEDQEVRDAYEQQKDKLLKSERRRVAHIAVATENEAKELKARIEKGEEFADLLTKSLDIPSIKSGGDLGWIEKEKVAEVYAPLFTLPLGGVGAPIQSEKAWHVVRVSEIEPPRPLTFDEVKDKLRSNLLDKKKHDAREFWIAKLRKASEIKVLDEGVKSFVVANPYTVPGK
ncbi:MAG: peptidyl-prolyl cis-trans isomerase [Thermoanaerobaculia bacterium]|nr:peptidyl-prolyl cis-trans isomerase [Thermoanaerobaculia bacterium]